MFANDKNHRKVRDNWNYTGKYRGAAHSICILKFDVPNEIPVVFHNGSNYDCYFIIKELATESKGHFKCLWENAEKYKTFPLQQKMKRQILIKMVVKVLSVYLTKKVIDSARCMASSWSNLVDNLTEGIHKIKFEDCDCFLEYESVKENLIKYKCLSCNKDYSNKLDEKLKKLFKNTFKVSDNDTN